MIILKIVVFIGTLFAIALILEHENDSLWGIFLSVLLFAFMWRWVERAEDTIEIEEPQDGDTLSQ